VSRSRGPAFLELLNRWDSNHYTTLIFGNPWQNPTAPHLLRYGVYWVLLLGTFFLGDRCARRPAWFQAVVVALLALNLATARGYARWAAGHTEELRSGGSREAAC
jgi:hypothetical protein